MWGLCLASPSTNKGVLPGSHLSFGEGAAPHRHCLQGRSPRRAATLSERPADADTLWGTRHPGVE